MTGSATVHGTGCQCAHSRGLDALGLPRSVVSKLQKYLRRHDLPDRIDSVLAFQGESPALDEATATKIRLAIDSLRRQRCTTRFADEADVEVPWRTYYKAGLDTAPDRWPDEWDGRDWSLWSAGSLDQRASESETFAKARQLMASQQWPRQRHLTRREIAELSLANRGDLWIDGALLALERVDWPHDESIRLLAAARSALAVPPYLVAQVAQQIGRPASEVIAYVEYLRQCDQGLVRPDETVWALLADFPKQASAVLVKRVRMFDETTAREPTDAESADEAEFLDAVEPALDLPEVARIAAADGGPNPLATIRKLLPGGEGTRGRPPIVYVPTRLDGVLLPALIERDPTLVVLSGNAGDGKTAFITEVLKHAAASYAPGVNEYRIAIGRNPYLVVLDGSEDDPRRTNHDLLQDALGGFAGAAEQHPAQGTLIAINKGRLLSFLEVNKERFGFLWEVVRGSLVSGEAPADHPYVIIDLNDRTNVGPALDDSLFSGVIRRLTEWPEWESECSRCDAVQVCPALRNVEQLRRRDVQEQLWRILAAADMDDRLHITARHLVTKVASLVVSDQTCAGIRETARRGDDFGPAMFLYNNLFEGERTSTTEDRSAIDAVIGAYDPSELSSPRRDRRSGYRLAGEASTAIGDLNASGDGAYLSRAVAALERATIDERPQPGMPEYRLQLLQFMRWVSRRLYMLYPDHDLAPRFPLRSFDEFIGALSGADDVSVRDALIQNLNGTLGVENSTIPDLLAPRDYGRGLRGRGLAAMIPRERFRVVPATKLGAFYRASPFLESWPRGLALVAEDSDGTEVASLAVSLLLYEVLQRAGRGFRPATQSERSFTVRLSGFYRRLAEYRWTVAPDYAMYDNGNVLGRTVPGAR